MYDVAGDRPLREQLISLYSQRAEPEATDKLLDIARTGTDPDLRRYAISALSRKNDPRTKKLLVEIIDKND
jgi:HEAT repeat protein